MPVYFGIPVNQCDGAEEKDGLKIQRRKQSFEAIVVSRNPTGWRLSCGALKVKAKMMEWGVNPLVKTSNV